MIALEKAGNAEVLKINDSTGSTACKEKTFLIEVTDSLLKTTHQYEKWRGVMQKDPSEALEIARLVVERHEYVSGKRPVNDEGREIFDDLTRGLCSKGIYLYRSDQFRDPIFASVTGAGRGGEDSAPISGQSSDRSGKDCYEYLVGMIESRGISYYGSGGISSELIDRAASEGRNMYAYFNGEGITDLLCPDPVKVEVPDASEEQFEKVWQQIEPNLEEGAILSYSSRRFGHTGLVSRANGEWNYLNSSGNYGDKDSYRVIEEDLKSEVKGWLRRAERDNAFISITLGRIDTGLARRFAKASFDFANDLSVGVNILT
jgi:hypothetical protein